MHFEIIAVYFSRAVFLQYSVMRNDGLSPDEREYEKTRAVTSKKPLRGAVTISPTSGMGMGISDSKWESSPIASPLGSRKRIS